MVQHVLLTGATGLVGHYLLRDLLSTGVPVAAVIRARNGESAADRLERVLTRLAGASGRRLPRPVCLEGDVTEPGLGLSAGDRRWAARHCGAVIHNAASLQFHGQDRGRDPWLSNLTGTAHTLELCRELRLRELHYVSTAYVCGRREEVVFEADLDRGQAFTNAYEECKFQAEKLVRSADFLDGLTVYRPAVIVGDSRTGFTTTYHGLYAYFQFVWLASPGWPIGPDGRRLTSIRLNLTGAETRNLVPVDWVSDVISHVVRHPRHHGTTYHLTPTDPVRASELAGAMATYFNVHGHEFAGRDAFVAEAMTAEEQLFYSFLERYQPYWESEPTFDCTNTLAAAPHLPCPRLDAPMLHRLLDFAIEDRWGKGRPKRPARARSIQRVG